MFVFKKQYNYSRYFLNICTAAILFIHGIAGMFNEGMQQFGSFLDQQGLAPLGLFSAWIIKLSHIWAAFSILTGKWRFWILLFTIFILLTGIFMVHLPHGWFVVGGGFNGIEFNLLLIAALVTILFQSFCSQRDRQLIYFISPRHIIHLKSYLKHEKTIYHTHFNGYSLKQLSASTANVT